VPAAVSDVQAGVLSLLTAVLLNASPTCTPAEAASRALPPNFVEAAHLVMAVLNNVCRLDLMAGQFMLACAHHRMEFYHLISFLLSYCRSRWPAPVSPRAAAPAPAGPAAGAGVGVGVGVCAAQAGPAGQQGVQTPPPQPPQQQQPQQQQQEGEPRQAASAQQSSSSGSVAGSQCSPSKAESGRPPGVAAVLHHPIAHLLNQVLLLIGYFCVQHPSNQAMLTWGRSPSILQRLCSLPQEYLQVPELRAVLMPTLLCVCYGAERTCETVAQHFDLEVLLQYVQQQQAQAQQQQQQRTQEAPEAQHPAGLTRQERRRQRKIQQRQQQEQLGKPQGVQQEQQELPQQAQQVLQQLSPAGCSNAGGIEQACTGSSAAGSEAPVGGAGPNGSSAGGAGNSSSSTGRSLRPGRSRHIMFALCRRFPLQLLPLAAQQLGTLGLGGCSSSSADPLPNQAPRTCQESRALELSLGAESCHGSEAHGGEAPHLHQQQQQQSSPQQAQQEAPGTAAEQPPLAEPVSLQLQIQRTPAAKLVQCEVVACS
jgi:hypothetical protein